jgi:hypothetical protein
VYTVTNLRFPWNVRKILSRCATRGFSRRAQLHLGTSFKSCEKFNQLYILPCIGIAASTVTSCNVCTYSYNIHCLWYLSEAGIVQLV